MKRRRFVLATLFLIGVRPAESLAFQSTSQPAKPAPNVKVDKSVVDVGICWCNSTIKAVFLFQNLGPVPLEITQLRSPYKCELDPQSPRRIAPQQPAEIALLTQAPSEPGLFERNALIETNDPRTPGVIVKIHGEARTAIEADPPMAGFGNVSESRPAQMVITLTNHSDEPVKIDYERIDDSGFSFELSEKEPGKVYQLKVSLKPPFDPGIRRAAINLTTDLAIQPNIPIRAYANIAPRVAIVPNMIMLGPPDPQNEIQKVVVFTNNSDTPIRVIEASTDDPAITLSVNDIVPGKGYRIVATFPKNYDPGTTVKVIRLRTDDMRKSDYEVGVLGPLVPTSPTESKSVTIPIGELVGKPAPKFDLTTVDGQVINNASATTHVLALNFFTSNNFNNTMAVQNFEELRNRYEPRGVRFVNIAEQGPAPGPVFEPGSMKYSLKKAGVNAELAMDLGNIAADALHLGMYPTLAVIGKSGKIEFAVEGNPPDYLQRTKALFEALLGPAPTKSSLMPTSAPTPEEIQKRPALGMIGLAVPQFSIKTVDGKPVGDEEIQNSPATVLNIVAANCGFCQRQLPLVESIRDEYQKKGVRFVNVCQTLKKRMTLDEVVEKMKTIGSKSELAYDPNNKISVLFKATSFPTLFVVRRDGRIESATVGAKRNTDEILRQRLDEVLKGDVALKGNP